MVPEITVIAEHSVCLELLPEKAIILDAGCRGFEFTNYFRECGHEVLALDISKLDGAKYLQLALGSTSGASTVVLSHDPQGSYIKNVRKIAAGEDPRPNEIRTITIEGAANAMGIKSFDLVKLDVEGAEDEILCKAVHPIAKQISVEFHAHTGRQTKPELDALLSYLSEWYTIHNRVWESRHGAGFNYWDILLIAK